ncbi:MAG: hypothetical protein KF734_18325 [Saprospiraceae bacterium]|nr:hypothetical protein [Saprospiraceae bacterium]
MVRTLKNAQRPSHRKAHWLWHDERFGATCLGKPAIIRGNPDDHPRL